MLECLEVLWTSYINIGKYFSAYVANLDTDKQACLTVMHAHSTTQSYTNKKHIPLLN